MVQLRYFGVSHPNGSEGAAHHHTAIRSVPVPRPSNPHSTASSANSLLAHRQAKCGSQCDEAIASIRWDAGLDFVILAAAFLIAA